MTPLLPPNPIQATLEIRIIPCLPDQISFIETLAKDHIKQETFLLRGHMPNLLNKDDRIKRALLGWAGTLERVPFWRALVKIHVYVCAEDMPDCGVGMEENDNGSAGELVNMIALPSERFEGVWEGLEFGGDIKDRLLAYVGAGWVMGKTGVDSAVVGWNGVLLLHGPPGTGKTSLCQGLMQKVCVRFGVGDGVLVEVKVEKLLSKWFSESTVRMASLFQMVRELAIERGCVGVLLDEVESLGMCRKGRVGNEPGDAIRVVNALLGGVDSLRGSGNVIVVCTSNLMEGIDEALVDRVDVSLMVRKPGLEARVRIIERVLEELVIKGVVKRGDGVGVRSVGSACEGISGRGLRKLGVLALAELGGGEVGLPVEWGEFLKAMAKAGREILSKGVSGEDDKSVGALLAPAM